MTQGGAAFYRQVELIIRSDLSPEEAARDFARRAREGIEADVRAGRFPRRYRTFVDGKPAMNEVGVKPGGNIVYEVQYGAEILLFALGFLYARSPTGPMATGGERLYRQPYRESFYVSLDGRFIRPGELRPELVPDGIEMAIGNVQPYSRRIDVQLVGNKRLRFNQPENLFADCAKAINRTFGNFVSAKRVYTLQFPGQYRIKNTQFRTGTRSHNVKRWAGTLVESPAVVIAPR